MKSQQRHTSIKVLGAFFALLAAGNVNGAIIAYEDFNYASGTNFNTTTSNGGTGWAGAWTQFASVPGLQVSGTGQSLHFLQSPVLATDGSSHVFATGNRANSRIFSTGVAPTLANPLYVSVLIRSFIEGSQTPGGAQMRIEFADSAGLVRFNAGIDKGALFAANRSGYSTTNNHNFLADAFEDNTTYLLVMKRTSQEAYASLIEASGDLSTLNTEPTWQVSISGTTSLTFDRLNFIMNGTDTGLRADELRIATSWAGVVDGLQVIPEPGTYALILSALCLAFVGVRRRASRG
jgi:hypothetical protein